MWLSLFRCILWRIENEVTQNQLFYGSEEECSQHFGGFDASSYESRF